MIKKVQVQICHPFLLPELVVTRVVKPDTTVVPVERLSSRMVKTEWKNLDITLRPISGHLLRRRRTQGGKWKRERAINTVHVDLWKTLTTIVTHGNYKPFSVKGNDFPWYPLRPWVWLMSCWGSGTSLSPGSTVGEKTFSYDNDIDTIFREMVWKHRHSCTQQIRSLRTSCPKSKVSRTPQRQSVEVTQLVSCFWSCRTGRLLGHTT